MSGPAKKTRRRRSRVATTAEAAVLDWAPWAEGACDYKPPSNAEWVELANPYLVTLRVADRVMYKSKSEVMEMLEKMDDDVGRAVMNSFIDTISFFKASLTVLEAAEARILVAGSSLIEQDEASRA